MPSPPRGGFCYANMEKSHKNRIFHTFDPLCKKRPPSAKIPTLSRSKTPPYRKNDPGGRNISKLVFLHKLEPHRMVWFFFFASDSGGFEPISVRCGRAPPATARRSCTIISSNPLSDSAPEARAFFSLSPLFGLVLYQIRKADFCFPLRFPLSAYGLDEGLHSGCMVFR